MNIKKIGARIGIIFKDINIAISLGEVAIHLAKYIKPIIYFLK